MSGVIRVENEGARQRGWIARVWDKGPPTHYFGDMKWGGKRAAYYTAERWLFRVREKIASKNAKKVDVQKHWKSKWKAILKGKES